MLIGLAAWFHLLAAALVGLWLGAAALGRWTARTPGAGPRPVLWLAAPAVVLALPVLVPVALDQAAGGADPAGPSALYVHAVFRNPWHHLFFSFPAGQQVRFWTLMTLGVVSAVALARRNRLAHAADVGRLWGLAAVAGLLAVLFVEAWPVEAVAKLQLFKLAVPSALLATLCVSTWLADRIPEAWRARGRAWWTAHGTAASALTTVAVVAVLAVGAMGHGPYTTRFEPLTHPATPMGRVEAWARTATPEGALFAVPPSASTFRSRARRAVVITWNGFIFGDREMQTWYRRLQSVAPIAPPPRGSDPREALDASYAARAPAAWEALRAAYGIDFAVVPDSVRLPYPVAFQTDGWHVVRVTPAAP